MAPDHQGEAAPPANEAPDRPFEVWRVQRGKRSPSRAFVSLGEALRYIHSHDSGHFDVRLPDGSWFSEGTTLRMPREG